MSRRDRSIALGWWAIAAVATTAWFSMEGPFDALAEFAGALAFPIAAGRTIGIAAPRSPTAPVLVAASAATVAFLLALFLLGSAASPWAGMLGAAIGYRSERRRLRPGTEAAAPAELLRARTVRRLVVGLAAGSFTVACVWRAELLGAADLRAEWQIRAFLSGIVAAWALVGAAIAHADRAGLDER